MRTIEECSKKFIDGLGNRDHARVDVRKEEEWLGGAIIASQGQGNPMGSRLKLPDAVKAEIDRCLHLWRTMIVDDNLAGYHQFEKITAESFDRMHSLVEILDPGCLLFFGRVQKIHNIWLKYQIALFYSGYAPAYTAANPGIGRLLSLAHVPVDNVVLDYIHDHNIAPACITNIGTARLDWKLKLQKPRYVTLQDYLHKEALTAGYDSPLHYEMDMIWVPSRKAAKLPSIS